MATFLFFVFIPVIIEIDQTTRLPTSGLSPFNDQSLRFDGIFIEIASRPFFCFSFKTTAQLPVRRAANRFVTKRVLRCMSRSRHLFVGGCFRDAIENIMLEFWSMDGWMCDYLETSVTLFYLKTLLVIKMVSRHRKPHAPDILNYIRVIRCLNKGRRLPLDAVG